MHACYPALLRTLRATIGHNIQNLRAQHKLTMLQLERKTGIPAHRLDQFELGKNEIRLDELVRIACVLRTETVELLR